MTIHPLFTVHTYVTAIYVFSDVLDLSKPCVPYIKTFSTLSGVRNVFWILPQLDILCTSAVKWYYAKMTILYSSVTCLVFMEARKTCRRVVRTSIWSIPYSAELCNNCIVKTSETLIVWNTLCYTAGSGKWDAIKGMPDRLLKGAAKVFRVHHSRQVELMFPHWCS